MDELDRKLIISLQRDPRLTYREISNQLCISVPTAQRRVESLFNSGRIRSIRYRLSLDALGGKWVFFHGQAKIKLTSEVIKGLMDHGSISRVLQCAYNYVACHVDIREQEDIAEVMSFLMSGWTSSIQKSVSCHVNRQVAVYSVIGKRPSRTLLMAI